MRRLLILCLLPLAAACGCARPGPAADSAADSAASAPAATQPDDVLHDDWEVVYIQGARVGYGHTTVVRQQRGGKEVLRIECLNHLTMVRGRDETQQDIRFASVETPDGQLLEFDSEITMGQVPSKTVGRVEEGKLRLSTSTLGKVETSAIEWKPEYGGPYAMELSLQRQPLAPGQTRTLRHLAPGFNEPATLELSARQIEPVQLPGGTYELQRIETVMRFSNGMALPGTIWVDRTGAALKTFQAMLNMESYRASKEMALDRSDLGRLDLLATTSVPLTKPLDHPHQAAQLRYRATLADGDPAAVFVSGPSQRVVSLGPHEAEITVYGLRPGVPGNPGAKEAPPTDDDRQPNNSIQSDDPAVVAMAREAAGDETDPWKTAVALERYVRGVMKKVNFSQAFATAAEVARSREGDCTEHAVLLAGLLRARGIPARVAVGLVYVQGQQSFAYHMWTEAWIVDRWIPLDGTLGQGGIGGGHLKLAHSPLKGSSQYLSFLPVIQVMGRLKLEALPQ